MPARIETFRHPLSDPLDEFFIFNGPPVFGGGGLYWKIPPWVAGLGDKARREIEDVFKQNVQLKKQLNECRKEKSELKAILEKAESAYREKHPTSHQRNVAVVQVLGLSKGKRPPEHDPKQIYREYVYLVRKEGLTRDEAVAKITGIYQRNSKKALVKVLRDEKEKLIDGWKKANPSRAVYLKKFLRNLVPTSPR
jgi:hypothetical protein